MSTLGQVVAIMVVGFLTGGLARLAIPGPDPMPAWLTVSIGLVGSAIGGTLGGALTGRDATGISFGSFVVAVILVGTYRKFVQKRPLLGVEALRYPRRGVGVREQRERLARAGIDPDALLDRALAARREAEARERAEQHSPDDPDATDDESPRDESPRQ